MHEKETVTENEFDIILQMSLDGVLPQQYKQITKWIAKVTNTNKQVGNSS